VEIILTPASENKLVRSIPNILCSHDEYADYAAFTRPSKGLGSANGVYRYSYDCDRPQHRAGRPSLSGACPEGKAILFERDL
jgi:hypothetical protein